MPNAIIISKKISWDTIKNTKITHKCVEFTLGSNIEGVVVKLTTIYVALYKLIDMKY